MTPEQIEMVRASAGRVALDGQRMAGGFYRELFEREPDLRAMFGDDVDAQARKFSDSLTTIIEALPQFPDFDRRVAALGARHVRLGVTARHYELVGDCLLTALAEADAAAWDSSLEDAWRAAYDLVAESMTDRGTQPREP